MSTKHFFLLSSFFLVHSFLQAQDSSYNQLNEVVVTANKFEQKQNTTGKVITIINKEMIDKSVGKTLSQLLNEQAGIIVNGALNNQGSVQKVYMRGASSGRTLILLDGIPVNDPSMISNEFDLNLFSLSNVERIEICKGAQSTLYGSDAVAGVINIITTKKDVSKAFNGNAMLSAGNYCTLKGNAQVYGKAGKFSYMARYARLYTDGFSSAKDTGNNHFDKDGYKGDALSGNLQFQATNNLSFKAFIQYSNYKSDIDQGPFSDDRDYTIHNKSLLAGAGFTYKNDKVNLVGNFQYNELNRTFLNDSTDIPSYLIFDRNHYFSKTQFAEMYASINLGSGFTLLQGGDFRYGGMHSYDYSKSSFGTDVYEFTTLFPDTMLSQASLYSSLNYNSRNNKLNVELGGRVNVHSRYGTNYTYTFNPSYALSKQTRVFGSIASGFKAPTLYQLYSAYGDPALQPEKSVNFEAGIQTNTESLNVRAAYFYRHIRSGLDFDNFAFKYFNNVQQIVRGLELELTYRPVKEVTITANYSYLAAGETTQQRISFAKDTTYKYSLRRPKHSLNATVGYQPLPQLYISFSGKYVSKRFDAGGYGVPDVQLDDYILFSAYAEYKLAKKLKLFAEAQNLFNKTFYDAYGYNSIPFLLNGGVTFSF